MTLPPEFLAARGEMLRIAADRQFRGSLEPIPGMPEWPGIYTPKGDTINLELAQMERNNREANNRKCKAFRERKRLVAA
jgi:hypothetical protein